MLQPIGAPKHRSNTNFYDSSFPILTGRIETSCSPEIVRSFQGVCFLFRIWLSRRYLTCWDPSFIPEQGNFLMFSRITWVFLFLFRLSISLELLFMPDFDSNWIFQCDDQKRNTLFEILIIFKNIFYSYIVVLNVLECVLVFCPKMTLAQFPK